MNVILSPFYPHNINIFEIFYKKIRVLRVQLAFLCTRCLLVLNQRRLYHFVISRVPVSHLDCDLQTLKPEFVDVRRCGKLIEKLMAILNRHYFYYYSSRRSNVKCIRKDFIAYNIQFLYTYKKFIKMIRKQVYKTLWSNDFKLTFIFNITALCLAK